MAKSTRTIKKTDKYSPPDLNLSNTGSLRKKVHSKRNIVIRKDKQKKKKLISKDQRKDTFDKTKILNENDKCALCKEGVREKINMIPIYKFDLILYTI
jgi:hypothetical protein